MKAIAYVSPISSCTGSGEVCCADQRRRIEEYARQQGIEIIAWFEDEARECSLMDRTGLRAALRFEGPWSSFLVDRCGCLSRSMAALRPLLALLDLRGAKLVAATELWDVVSQKVRSHYRRTPSGVGHGREVTVPADAPVSVFAEPLPQVVLPAAALPARHSTGV